MFGNLDRDNLRSKASLNAWNINDERASLPPVPQIAHQVVVAADTLQEQYLFL